MSLSAFLHLHIVLTSADLQWNEQMSFRGCGCQRKEPVRECVINRRQRKAWCSLCLISLSLWPFLSAVLCQSLSLVLLSSYFEKGVKSCWSRQCFTSNDTISFPPPPAGHQPRKDQSHTPPGGYVTPRDVPPPRLTCHPLMCQPPPTDMSPRTDMTPP